MGCRSHVSWKRRLAGHSRAAPFTPRWNALSSRVSCAGSSRLAGRAGPGCRSASTRSPREASRRFATSHRGSAPDVAGPRRHPRGVVSHLRPPAAAVWLLRRVLPPDAADAIVGDLIEELGLIGNRLRFLRHACSLTVRYAPGSAPSRGVRHRLKQRKSMETLLLDVKYAARSLSSARRFSSRCWPRSRWGIGRRPRSSLSSTLFCSSRFRSRIPIVSSMPTRRTAPIRCRSPGPISSTSGSAPRRSRGSPATRQAHSTS